MPLEKTLDPEIYVCEEVTQNLVRHTPLFMHVLM